MPTSGSHLVWCLLTLYPRETSLLLYILPGWIHSFPLKKNSLPYTYNSYTSISKHFPESQIYGSSFLDIATWILRDPSTLKVQNQAHVIVFISQPASLPGCSVLVKDTTVHLVARNHVSGCFLIPLSTPPPYLIHNQDMLVLTSQRSQTCPFLSISSASTSAQNLPLCVFCSPIMASQSAFLPVFPSIIYFLLCWQSELSE